MLSKVMRIGMVASCLQAIAFANCYNLGGSMSAEGNCVTVEYSMMCEAPAGVDFCTQTVVSCATETENGVTYVNQSYSNCPNQ